MKQVGVVPYLNALPLIHYLDGYHLIKAVPTKLCSQFEKGDLDVALLPIYELFKKPIGLIVDGISISSQSEAGSVLLFLNVPLERVKKIALDSSSLSSNHLLKLLLKKYYRVECDFQVISPENLVQESQNHDAYLLIGDQALYHRKLNPSFIDLGRAWHEWTGLPFVFAVWVTKDKDERLKNDLLKSKRKGLSNLSQIITQTSYPDKAFLENYYQSYLHFSLGETEKKGLEHFQKSLYQADFLSQQVQLTYF